MTDTKEPRGDQAAQAAHEARAARAAREAQMRTLRSRGDMDGAIHVAYALFAEDMADVAIATELATMLAEEERVAHAERIFDHAFKLNPHAPLLRLNHGIFLAATDRLDEAREELEALYHDLTWSVDNVTPNPHAQTSSLDDDRQSRLEEDKRYLSMCAISLAQACAEMGDLNVAIAYLSELLTAPGEEIWRRAHELLVDVLADRGDDFINFSRYAIKKKQASPLMVLRVAEVAGRGKSDALAAAEVLLAGGDFLDVFALKDAIAGDEAWGVFIRWVMGDLAAQRARGHAVADARLEDLEILLILPDIVLDQDDDRATPSLMPLASISEATPSTSSTTESSTPPHRGARPPHRGARPQQVSFAFGHEELPLFRRP